MNLSKWGWSFKWRCHSVTLSICDFNNVQVSGTVQWNRWGQTGGYTEQGDQQLSWKIGDEELKFTDVICFIGFCYLVSAVCGGVFTGEIQNFFCFESKCFHPVFISLMYLKPRIQPITPYSDGFFFPLRRLFKCIFSQRYIVIVILIKFCG